MPTSRRSGQVYQGLLDEFLEYFREKCKYAHQINATFQRWKANGCRVGIHRTIWIFELGCLLVIRL